MRYSPNLLFILCFFLSLIFTDLKAQKLANNKQNSTREVELIYTDSTIVAGIYTKQEKIKTKYPLMYNWYFQEKLGQSQGDYWGYLLHGSYCVYDKKNRLIRKGDFKFGLKNGSWKSWYLNGILRINEAWENGMAQGCWNYYSPAGKLIKTVEYKKGQLSGKTIIYQGDSCIVRNYADGKEKIASKTKKKWFSFLHKRTAKLKHGEIHCDKDRTNH
jgi:antitoxin component YwqK of YwqJK toxin-antitoxin module